MHAINKTLISIIIFEHKPNVFVEINGPLSSVNFNNKFFHSFMSNTNSIHVLSEKIKNYTGDCEKHSEISIIGQYLKSIAFTKFDNAKLLLAVKIRIQLVRKRKEHCLKQVQNCPISFSTLEIIKHKKWIAFFLYTLYTGCLKKTKHKFNRVSRITC